MSATAPEPAPAPAATADGMNTDDKGTDTLIELVRAAQDRSGNVFGRWYLARAPPDEVLKYELVHEQDWLRSAVQLGQEELESMMTAQLPRKGLNTGKFVEGLLVCRAEGAELYGGKPMVWLAFGTRPNRSAREQIEHHHSGQDGREESAAKKPKTRASSPHGGGAGSSSSSSSSAYTTPTHGEGR